jgi:hypothetical protein
MQSLVGSNFSWTDSPIMYRFRTIENLLGKYKELDNQEIYFASPGELNEPIEGFKTSSGRGTKLFGQILLLTTLKVRTIFSH